MLLCNALLVAELHVCCVVDTCQLQAAALYIACSSALALHPVHLLTAATQQHNARFSKPEHSPKLYSLAKAAFLVVMVIMPSMVPEMLASAGLLLKPKALLMASGARPGGFSTPTPRERAGGWGAAGHGLVWVRVKLQGVATLQLDGAVPTEAQGSGLQGTGARIGKGSGRKLCIMSAVHTCTGHSTIMKSA